MEENVNTQKENKAIIRKLIDGYNSRNLDVFELIFLSLMIVIVVLGGPVVQSFGVSVLVISISTFYWRLYPLIRKMDNAGQVIPRYYSRTVAAIILVMIIVFITSLALQYFGITWPL